MLPESSCPGEALWREASVGGLASVSDNRPLGLRFSIIELPGEPMETRLADDRMVISFFC